MSKGKRVSKRERHFQILRVYKNGREEVAWWAMRETETKAILRMHRKLRRPTDPTLDAREITGLLPCLARDFPG